MKKIYFDDMSNLKKNWTKPIMLFLGLILIIFGTFTEFLSEDWNKWIKASGYLLFSIYFLRKVIRKNYVQWNKLGMTVRINSYFGEKRITFSEINSYEFINDKLRIIQSSKTIELDLKNFSDYDKTKMIKIIEKYTVANNVFN
ncbi:hypothetical protein R3X25_11535 [Lutibacter sp. TH_r2]|uniref:hypothetical protein n=1 Tax=Lutibacter sp. TH_r2 TaxID=3082083 RepID=UPI0029539F39|nr:hypothetical protein [Lutibacter sp. TH_r2]MDV7187914.1 hypothetical protein [Lutibacter sp. TH_r2]